MFGFWWNFFLWIPTISSGGLFQFALGVVDLAIVLALIPAVYLESTYIPHSKGPCPNADSWQVPNGTASFFSLIAIADNATNPDVEGMCEEFVTNWSIGVSIMQVFLISLKRNQIETFHSGLVLEASSFVQNFVAAIKFC